MTDFYAGGEGGGNSLGLVVGTAIVVVVLIVLLPYPAWALVLVSPFVLVALIGASDAVRWLARRFGPR